jgi:hypothetical protein
LGSRCCCKVVERRDAGSLDVISHLLLPPSALLRQARSPEILASGHRLSMLRPALWQQTLWRLRGFSAMRPDQLWPVHRSSRQPTQITECFDCLNHCHYQRHTHHSSHLFHQTCFHPQDRLHNPSAVSAHSNTSKLSTRLPRSVGDAPCRRIPIMVTCPMFKGWLSRQRLTIISLPRLVKTGRSTRRNLPTMR